MIKIELSYLQKYNEEEINVFINKFKRYFNIKKIEFFNLNKNKMLINIYNVKKINKSYIKIFFYKNYPNEIINIIIEES